MIQFGNYVLYLVVLFEAIVSKHSFLLNPDAFHFHFFTETSFPPWNPRGFLSNCSYSLLPLALSEEKISGTTLV